jgi:hypothetical protein
MGYDTIYHGDMHGLILLFVYFQGAAPHTCVDLRDAD